MSVYSQTAEEKIKKKNLEIDAETAKATELVNKNADEAIRRMSGEVSASTSEANQAYRDSILRADLQKELDLRDIRESMAKSGMARSGISQTQQTAAVLSAGNKSAKADRQRLATIDALNKSLADYKNEMNLERENKLFSLEQTANQQKSAYAENQESWVQQMEQKDESARVSLLNTLGLDSVTLSKAVSEGWTPEYAAQVKKEKDEANEETRVSELDAAKSSGQLSEYIWQAAKAGGYTLQQALALQLEQNENDRQTLASAALDFLGKGYIDLNTYNRAVNGEIGIGELTKMAQKYVTAHNTKAADWTDALNVLYNDGEGVLTPQAYAMAIKNNWDPATALEYQNPKAEPAESLTEKYAKTAKQMLSGSLGKTGALNYLVDLYKNGYIDDVSFANIATSIGLTDEDVRNYNQSQPKQQNENQQQNTKNESMPQEVGKKILDYCEKKNGSYVFSWQALNFLNDAIKSGKVTEHQARVFCQQQFGKDWLELKNTRNLPYGKTGLLGAFASNYDNKYQQYIKGQDIVLPENPLGSVKL